MTNIMKGEISEEDWIEIEKVKKMKIKEKAEDITLNCWEELRGELTSIEKDDDFLSVIIDSEVPKRVQYPLNSKEADIIEREGVEVGDRVGLLRTDLERKPIVFINFEEV